MLRTGPFTADLRAFALLGICRLVHVLAPGGGLDCRSASVQVRHRPLLLRVTVEWRRAVRLRFGKLLRIWIEILQLSLLILVLFEGVEDFSKIL